MVGPSRPSLDAEILYRLPVLGSNEPKGLPGDIVGEHPHIERQVDKFRLAMADVFHGILDAVGLKEVLSEA